MLILMVAMLFATPSKQSNTEANYSGLFIEKEFDLKSTYHESFDLEFPITLFIDSRSPWQLSGVKEDLRNAELVYAQCEVAIHPIKLLIGTHNQLEEMNSFNDYVFTKDIPDKYKRPFAVYTNGSLRPPGAPPSAGYANRYLSKTHSFRELSLFTIFFGDGRLNYYPSRPNYVENIHDWTLAHELGHILLAMGHLNGVRGNIMEDSWELRGNELSADQCSRLRRARMVQEKNSVKKHWKELYSISD